MYGIDMPISRRSTLIGLGGLVAGGGALAATGAFDTVEAERTVSVETAGDADAFLGITAASQYEDEVVTDGDDVFELDIGGATTQQGGTGVNQNARTVFSGLVVLTNQGTQDVDDIDFELSGDGADILSIVENVDDDLPLGPDEETTFGIEVDLLNDSSGAVTSEGDINESEFDPIVTITAEN